MTNLTNFSVVIKKMIIPFIFLVLVIFLLTIIYNRFINKTENKLPRVSPPALQGLKQKAQKFQTTNLTIDNNQPESIYTFETNISTNSVNVTEKLLNITKIKTEPIKSKDINLGEGKLYSTNEGFILAYEKAVVFQKAIKQKLLKPLPQDIEPLKNSARDALTRVLDTSQVSLEPKITYLKFSGEDLEESSKENATLIQFFFEYNAAGLPLISNSPPISINMDADSNLIKMDILLLPQLTQQASYPTITSKSATGILEVGGGTLVKIESEREDAIAATSLGVVDLQRGYLAYYLDKHTNSISPVWVFEGIGKTFNKDAHVLYIVPAIDAKYFSTPKQP